MSRLVADNPSSAQCQFFADRKVFIEFFGSIETYAGCLAKRGFFEGFGGIYWIIRGSLGGSFFGLFFGGSVVTTVD